MNINKTMPTTMLRRVGLAVLYYAVGVLGMGLAYALRFDWAIPSEDLPKIWWACGLAAFVQVGVLAAFGQTKVIASFFSLMDLKWILVANGVSTVAILLAVTMRVVWVPRGVLSLDLILVTVGVVGVRVALRYWGERQKAAGFLQERGGASLLRPVAVVGAGDAGAALIREMLGKASLHLRPVVVLDDDQRKWGQRLHGVEVVGAPEALRDERWSQSIRKVIIAMPSAPAARIGEVARMCAELGLPSDTMPALEHLVSGRVKVSQLRPVQIEDLLRRPAVELDMTSIFGLIRGRVIAVTGAGGSIGSELCRQILAQGPEALVLIERCEVQLFQVEQELMGRSGRNIVVPLVADVADGLRMSQILLKHRPSVIFHAAAHKHVPMMEAQPGEALRNNAMGTATLARAAVEAGVDRFVLISTDKAINPTNAMGATKRVAEIFIQAMQASRPESTRFMAVRFGNVLGSSGSVVPTFSKQIAAGGPVTVTHKDVTRYFMTIPEAVGLVLQAGALGLGGEIFVLDMGEPVRIADMARQMIELSGYRPDEDIEIQYTGLRPGEKMFEELSHHREKLEDTGHPKIFRFVSKPPSLEVVERFFVEVGPLLHTADGAEIKRRMQGLVPEYKPYLH